MPTDDCDSISVTYTNSGGVELRHQNRLLAFLRKYGKVWDFNEEVADDKDDGTPGLRHFHGRVALLKTHRMDKIRTKAMRDLKCDGSEPHVIRKGIGYLYDDWEKYYKKDGKPVPELSNIALHPDHNWIYADPKKKIVKKQNKAVKYHLAFIQNDLDQMAGRQEKIDEKVMHRLLGRHYAADTIELGTPASHKNLLWRMLQLYEFKLLYPQEISMPMLDNFEPDDEEMELFNELEAQSE